MKALGYVQRFGIGIAIARQELQRNGNPPLEFMIEDTYILAVLRKRMKSIAFFNNKGGVGKTSLVYHLGWMFAELGHRVLAVDLDPQADLSAAFLDEETSEHL